MVSTGRGAEDGISIKGGKAFEMAHKLDTIVFDKIGTLTEDAPKLTDVFAAPGLRKKTYSLFFACSYISLLFTLLIGFTSCFVTVRISITSLFLSMLVNTLVVLDLRQLNTVSFWK